MRSGIPCQLLGLLSMALASSPIPGELITNNIWPISEGGGVTGFGGAKYLYIHVFASQKFSISRGLSVQLICIAESDDISSLICLFQNHILEGILVFIFFKGFCDTCRIFQSPPTSSFYHLSIYVKRAILGAVEGLRMKKEKRLSVDANYTSAVCQALC